MVDKIMNTRVLLVLFLIAITYCFCAQEEENILASLLIAHTLEVESDSKADPACLEVPVQ